MQKQGSEQRRAMDDYKRVIEWLLLQGCPVEPSALPAHLRDGGCLLDALGSAFFEVLSCLLAVCIPRDRVKAECE